MQLELQRTEGAVRLPPVPWRDPNTVEPADLARYIAELESACAANPQSADLHTCLGMAYAMNFDAHRSMDALEAAVEMDPDHFWAQLKYAELYYRLRALPKAKEEMLAALELARNPWEVSVARKHLQEIRRLMRDGTQKPAWTKPLGIPAVALLMMLVLVCVAMVSR